MRALVIKELKFIFCSSTAYFFSIAFLALLGAMLWLFDGQFNLLNNGVATLNNFFYLSPIFLSVLIPALTMRQFAEERRGGTLQVLMTRPTSESTIVCSKFISSFVFVFVTLLPTLIYVYSVYQLANPVGNIDLPVVAASYFSLLLVAAVYIAVGLFFSSTTSNQIVALVAGIVVNLFLYFGFELISSLSLSGKIQAVISSFGLFHHYQQMHRGVIQLKDLLVVVNYILLFLILTRYALQKRSKRMLVALLILGIVNMISLFIPNYRIDFTEDSRYTLDKYTKKLLEDVASKDENLTVQIWLTGDLNSGFTRLQYATTDLLADFNRYTDNKIRIEVVPAEYVYQNSTAKDNLIEYFSLNPIQLNEVDREGKASSKLIYPYALISNGKDTLAVALLKNIQGYSADENLNISVESLEFEFIDAIRLLEQEYSPQIAFIEGHGEIPRAYVYAAEEQLAKYFSVNRGEIGNEVGILDQFTVVIIAGPVNKFTEQEKYVIDQYIMSGGKVLWLIDGAYYSHTDLVNEGHSASMKNDVNLDDMLFGYGVRINSDLLQDKQCSQVLLLSGSDQSAQSSIAAPCLYMPLLMPSPNNMITKDIRDVKSAFVSSIDFVNKADKVDKSVLLTSSKDAHLVKVPETIDFDTERVLNIPSYFNQPYVVTAVSLEGFFPSVFHNRTLPDGLNVNGNERKDESKKTKMIVVASSDIIRNQIEGQGEDSTPLPMGFDRVSGRQYGNRDFIVNAVNWLADDTGLMQLRSRQQRLRMLSRQEVIANRTTYIILNIAMPIVFVLIVIGGVSFYRKRKYEK